MRHHTSHRSNGRRLDSSGFSLLEVLIALVVLAIVVGSVAEILVSQLSSTIAAKDEAVAQGQLTKAMAEVRAIPYSTLLKGLDTSDTTTDTANIHKTGATWTLLDSALRSTGTGEEILHSAVSATTPPSTPPPPLYPHKSTHTINGTPFSVATFPTQYETPPVHARSPAPTPTTSHPPAVVPGIVRLTIIVSWKQGSAGVHQITGQSLISTMGRCTITSDTRIPCKPTVTATATAGFGTVIVRPASSNTDPITGTQFSSLILALAGSSSSNSLVRTVSVGGSARATAGLLSGNPGAGTTSEVSTHASNDPASGVATYQALILTQNSTAVTAGPSGRSITATPSPGDIGSSTSTISAKATQSCDSLSGTAQDTSTPCGSGSATQHSTASIIATLSAFSLGAATLVKVDPQPTTIPDRSYTIRNNPGVDGCPTHAGTPTTYGCITSESQESLGTTSVGGLPASVTAPIGWSTTNGLLKLSNYSASASATVNSGSTTVTHASASVITPITGDPVPEVSYWNGHGYTTVPVTSLTNSVILNPVTAIDPSAPGGAVKVTMTATISPEPSSTQHTTTQKCVVVCSAHASSPSPLRATITYEATQGTTTPHVLCDLLITVNLGSALASASYQEAS